MNVKGDIEHNEDIVSLVDNFYKKVISDSSIGHIFRDHLSMDLTEHLPIMYSFWQSVLLETMTYRGNVMIKHIQLNRLTSLKKIHFDNWIKLWTETVDDMFIGDTADKAKQKAITMAELMQYKIRKSEDNNFIH